MRVLIVHEAPGGAGGVESYLASLMPALAARGHEVAFLYYNARSEAGPTRLIDARFPSASVTDEGLDGAIAKMREWAPDVCFSHNMGALEVDERLARHWPVVKMLHGYFGTCVSGQKAHAFPGVVPCAREFGPACLALYLPRRCGQLRPSRMVSQYAWTLRQRALFAVYSHVVVASGHLAAEYGRNGVGVDRLTVAPLFPTAGEGVKPMRPLPEKPAVLFMARMTPIKGGALLVQAIAEAVRLCGIPIRLIMAGDGPEQARIQDLTRSLGIDATVPGWLTGEARVTALRTATLVAIPSLWPEPFGLVGLEAAAHGVPAVAFDVGGIREWLRDNESGRLVRERDPHSLGRAIGELCASPIEVSRLGEGARRVARILSLEAHVAILERVLARAAGTPAAIA